MTVRPGFVIALFCSASPALIAAAIGNPWPLVAWAFGFAAALAGRPRP